MSNNYGHGNEENPRRLLSDEDILSLPQYIVDELMAECDYEPAKPEICDACAAYLLRT